jgi:hypothetical protein
VHDEHALMAQLTKAADDDVDIISLRFRRDKVAGPQIVRIIARRLGELDL